jgi:predicted nucleic acid-binding protein
MLFVDSSAWYAFFALHDLNHARVRAHLHRPSERLLTTDYCIDETLTLLMARGEVHRALEAGHALFHENIATIEYLKPNQVQRAWLLFQQRAAAGWSFTDCTSKIVIDDLGTAMAVALDDHFRQFGNVIVVP